jgi:hypothetical protein
VRQDGPGGAVGRTVTKKTSIKNGKKYEVSTDEILKPNGTKIVTETIKEDGKVRINKYELGADHTKKALLQEQDKKALLHH